VRQAEALDELLKRKHMKLEAVVELRVNESALLERVETRASETRARGEEVRLDDTPEVLIKRLAAYRAQTEPLIHYYSERRKLLTVDGMMTIEEVTREISRILHAIGAVSGKVSKKTGAAAGRRVAVARAAATRKGRTKKAAKRGASRGVKVKKAVGAARRAPKRGLKGAKRAGRKVSTRPVKKVTKRRAKA
jgi:adenylate kinase